jgi:sugar phosphate isomerase/epimerase
MASNGEWTLGLIDSAWFGSDYEGKAGREEAKRIGFESLDLFIGFDPGRMTKADRKSYVSDNQSAGLPIVSLVCTCLGLSDFNPAIRNYHVERARNIVDLAAEFDDARNVLLRAWRVYVSEKTAPGGIGMESGGRRDTPGRRSRGSAQTRTRDRTSAIRIRLHRFTRYHGTLS